MHVRRHVRTYACIHVCMYVIMYVRMYVRVCVCMYVCVHRCICTGVWRHVSGHINIWSPPPPPPRSTPASSTRFPEVASLHWTLLIYAENTVNSDTIVPFAMCMHTSRGFDMCINLAPNLGQRCMIVYVLEKLKCWRACYFCSCSTTKPRVSCVL